MSTPSSGYTPLGFDPSMGANNLGGYLGGLRLGDTGTEEASLAPDSSSGTEVSTLSAALRKKEA